MGQNEFAELEKRLLARFQSMIQKEIEPLKNDIKEMKMEQSQSVNSVTLENSEAISRKFQQSEEKHKRLQDRISYLEDQLLEKNIIFQGIYETEFEEYKDIKTQAVKAIAETMNGETEEEKKQSTRDTLIESIERMGRYNPLRTRPVKVSFTEKKDVDNLFKNRKKLTKGVFIDTEYSKATEKERRTLRPIIKAARRIDKFKGICKMEGPNFVLDGKKYHRQNLHTLPIELDLSKVTNNEVHAFFGKLNPLSNFHLCKFTVNNDEFHSSEQWIQSRKAEFCKDRITKNRIMNSEDPLDSKEITRDITNFNRRAWLDQAEEICYLGIKEKFLQNEDLMDALQKTENKTLIETSFDSDWGRGIPLSNENCLYRNKWKSEGILGRILMQIRKEINNTNASDEENISEFEGSGNNEAHMSLISGNSA